MKSLNVLLASVLALATIHTAQAQTVIRITGSTAYRAAVYQAIYTGASKTGNIPVIIKTSFSGSVGGISTLAANLTIGPSSSFTGGGGWLVDSTPQSASGTPNAPANYDSAITLISRWPIVSRHPLRPFIKLRN